MMRNATLNTKNMYKAIFTAMIFALVGNAQAQGLKIGYVDTTKIIEKAPQYRAAKNSLEKEFSPREKKIIAAQKALRKLEEKLNRDGSTMKDNDRQKLESQITRKRREIKRDQDNFREDFNLKRNQAVGKINRRVYETIVAYAKNNKFDLILSEPVVYVAKTIDITDKIVESLKKKAAAGK